MSENNHRKCAKCGLTRAEDMTVTYHRFPNPGFTNMTKARAWAIYCWPSKDWTSVEALQSLHTTNKVLCGRHFNSTQFYDSNRQKLSKFAVPDCTEVEELLNNRENILDQNIKQAVAAGQLHSRVPFSQIDNIQTVVLAEPSTSAVLSTQPCNANEQIPQIKMLTPETTAINDILSNHALPSHGKTPNKKGSRILRTLNVSRLSELTPREVKLYNFSRKKLKEIIRLRKNLKKLKCNKTKIFEHDCVRKLCDLNLSNSFIVLLQSQFKNCPKKPKGRRYSLEQKIIALVIYKKSPACYRLLRRNKEINEYLE